MGYSRTDISNEVWSFPDEIAYHLANSGASVVVTDNDLLPKVKDACKKCDGIRQIIVKGYTEKNLVSLEDLLKDDGKAFPSNVQVRCRFTLQFV